VIALAGALLATALASDPCASADVPPPARADPAAAALYRAVGDEARAAGDLPSARVAYLEALRLEPSAATLEALRAACRPAPPARAPAPVADHYDDGVELMQRGDRRGAIAAFEAARAEHEDAATALLEGVCAFELDDAERARALFEIARGHPAVAPTASFFLGMLALRQGESERAAAMLDEAGAGDARLTASATTLSVLARRGGRLVVSALTELGYDSNVELGVREVAPDGSVTPGASADGSALAAAGIAGRLFGASGPYARVGGQVRKQFVISAYDLGQASGAVGGRLVRGGDDVAAEYGYDFVSLGGAAYLSAHRALALARLGWGSTTIAATYSARLESFLTTATEPYSGLRQDAELDVLRASGRAVALGVGYHGERDDARSHAELSYLEHGPVALAQLAPAPSMRVVVEGRFSW